MKYPPLTADSVFRNNQPNTWVVRINAFGGPTVADCGADGEKFAKLFAVAPELLQELINIANAKPHEWEEDVRDQFQDWAQSRARWAIAKVTGIDK